MASAVKADSRKALILVSGIHFRVVQDGLVRQCINSRHIEQFIPECPQLAGVIAFKTANKISDFAYLTEKGLSVFSSGQQPFKKTKIMHQPPLLPE
jgi:hypothetical protein